MRGETRNKSKGRIKLNIERLIFWGVGGKKGVVMTGEGELGGF